MIEIIALLDYIELVLIFEEPENLTFEPVETIYIQYSDHPFISEIDYLIQNGLYLDAKELIDDYKKSYQKYFQIYKLIEEEYNKYKYSTIDEDLTNLIKDKFGVNHPEEIIALLKSKESFLVEHE